MVLDRLTKVLLAAIAVALWLNALNPWIQPRSAVALPDTDLSEIESYVSSIRSELGDIHSGTCLNSKIC